MLTTRTGDDGLTTWRNVRVSKNSKEIQLLGFLDQSMAELCIACVEAKTRQQEALFADLEKIHGMLSDICAILAADVQRDLLPLLLWCDRKTRGVSLDHFVFFGTSNQLAAYINKARTSVRLAESHLLDACDEQNPLLRVLLNRLSDALFVLALNAAG